MKKQNYPLYEVEPLNNLKELVDYAAEKYKNNPAFLFERKKETVSISYRQFKSDVEALGTALFDLGIKNEKISLIGENSYEWILTYFAVVNSGNVIVPLDKELPATEIKNLVDHSDSEVFVYSDTYADFAEYLQNNNVSIRHYINMGSLSKMVEKGNSLIQHGEKSISDYIVNNNILAVLMYTSGTTGNAKGVMLSHENITKNAVGALQNISLPDSSLLILPIHHLAGLTGGVLTPLIIGCSVAINLSLKTLQNDFIKYKPRYIMLVPLFVETFYKQIKATVDENDAKESSTRVANKLFGGNLVLIVCGGAPLNGKYVKGFSDFGITVLNVYGLTECSALISGNRNLYSRADSGGQLLPCCEVIISNPDEDGYGEIYSKGETNMLGYYKNQQATNEIFDGEWLKTGDIGHLDEDGFLFISGRKKNVIILSNGKNVYPEELESSLLNQIPYIQEIIIYAESDIIVAEVFLNVENDPDCASRLNSDILAFNQTQPFYKNIGKTVIRDTDFPKTTTKKIKRHEG